ncbi:MAG: type II toxin-antitoxin system RelE/ParE family toxin [Saprospirales bacterium]|nr:MAG: type II toxin-antitoxin system RelE/ParE family toxin [Saprospirales bacterium]
MDSEIKVLWTDQAIENLESILNYLESEWSPNTTDSFKDKLTRALNLLKKFPTLGSESSLKQGIRRFVMSIQVSIFYEIYNDTMIIHYLFDNRQDPKNIE